MTIATSINAANTTANDAAVQAQIDSVLKAIASAHAEMGNVGLANRLINDDSFYSVVLTGENLDDQGKRVQNFRFDSDVLVCVGVSAPIKYNGRNGVAYMKSFKFAKSVATAKQAVQVVCFNEEVYGAVELGESYRIHGFWGLRANKWTTALEPSLNLQSAELITDETV